MAKAHPGPVLFGLAALALLFLLPQALPAGEDWSASPSDWQLLELRGPGKVAVQLPEADSSAPLEITAVEPGFTVSALAASLGPAKDLPGRVGLRFEYLAEGGGLPLSASLSSGTGWAGPYVRFAPAGAGNGEWRTALARVDLDGFPPDRDVFVQIWAIGRVDKGQLVRVRNLALAAAPLPPVDAWLASPGSGVLISGDPDERTILGLRSLGRERAFTARVLGPDGREELKATARVKGESRLSLDSSALPPGSYSVKASARPGSAEFSFDLEKVPSRPDRVVIRQGVPWVGSEPFFMIGLYHVGDPVFDIINKENERLEKPERLTRKGVLAQVAHRSFNTVLYPWGLAPEDFCADARAAGLMVVSGSAATPPAQAAALAEKSPAVFGFYGVDEPSASDTAKVEAAYRAYKRADPYNPVMTAMDNGCVGFGRARFVDVAMPDPYPVSGPDSDVSAMALYVRNCRRVLFGDDPAASVTAVPQLFTLDSERWKGFHPAPAQVRAQVYAALAAGAKGIMYYAYYTHEPLAGGMPANPGRTHWFLPESPLWDHVRALNKELRKLAPILVAARDMPGAQSQDPEMIASLFKADGQFYLVAANPLGKVRTDRRIFLPWAVKAAYPVVGSPLARAKGMALSIDFPPYGAGAWRLVLR